MKVIAVMPAYNAARTLEPTVRDIPGGTIDEIILVDDASTDNTVEIAQKLGLTVIRHETNRGYGANQKTCYRLALDRGADIVIMIHPDYQYDSRLTPYLIGFLKEGFLDVMLGSRIRTRKEALSGGMPLYKYLANRILTFIENILLGMNLSEWHTGFRAYTRKVLETIPWHDNSDDFVFDSQVLVQCVSFGFRIGEIPIPVRYHDTSSSINFRRSMKYGILTIVTALRFVLHRLHIVRSRLFAEP
jgi:glycosyltransferase involved in cell wall biosynthesis